MNALKIKPVNRSFVYSLYNITFIEAATFLIFSEQKQNE